MELVRPGMTIDFVGKRKWAYSVSLLMILVTIVLFIWRGGPNYGIEGTHIQEFEEEGQAEYLIRIGKVSDVASDHNIWWCFTTPQALRM